MSDLIDKIILENNMSKRVGSGGFHSVTDNGNGYIKKRVTNKISKNERQEMKKHILMFIRYPELFPHVKYYNDYEIIIEKVNTEKAKQEVEYIFNLALSENIRGLISKYSESKVWWIGKSSIPILEEIFNKTSDTIVKKWIVFIKDFTNKIPGCDCKIENIGIDKQGTIKLVDW